MTKDQEFYIQIYDLALEALESYEPREQYTDARLLLDYIDAADVREFAEELVSGMRELAERDWDGPLNAAVASQKEVYTRLQRPDTSVHIDESEIGFVRGALQIYDLYENGDILFSEAGKAIENLAKMAEERGYDRDVCAALSILGSDLKIGWSKGYKDSLQDLRRYMKEHGEKITHEKEYEQYHKTTLRELCELLSEFTNIVVRQADGTLEKPMPVYEDIVDMDQIRTEYLDREVMSVGAGYDEDLEEPYIEIWIY